MCIEGKFPDKPLDTVYLGLYILDTEMIHPHERELEKSTVEAVATAMLKFMKDEFNLNHLSPTLRM
jgi:hypothetical protein